jgi:hypothetical protein
MMEEQYTIEGKITLAKTFLRGIKSDVHYITNEVDLIWINNYLQKILDDLQGLKSVTAYRRQKA